MLFEHEFSDFSNLPDIGNDWDSGQTFSPWRDAAVGSDTTFVSQTTPFTCAVVSQEMILNDFGIDVSESQLVYTATSNGWLTENGTSISDMGNLLEYYGVSAHTNYNGDLSSMVNELARGHKVIVAVDSGELWSGGSFWEKLTGIDNNTPDHAIVVSGVDFSDVNNPQVVVNDPGIPDGAGMRYPLAHFLEAWNDSNCTYVATDNAPPDIANDPNFNVNFNPQSEIYSTRDFWINVASNVAGFTAAFTTACLLEDISPDVAVTNPDFIDGICSIVGIVTSEVTSIALDQIVNEKQLHFTPVLETFNNADRNQLFLDI
ncbi:MAG: C39 family peptidase [Planctomycetaceae bacterium]|jgi:hypothetical protein|nr:C39 family peptidase [Planctomycetaceae bacterium]